MGVTGFVILLFFVFILWIVVAVAVNSRDDNIVTLDDGTRVRLFMPPRGSDSSGGMVVGGGCG